MSDHSVYIVRASFRLPSASNWSEFSSVKTSNSSPVTQINSDFWNSRNITCPNDTSDLCGGIIKSPFFADLSQLGIGKNEWSCLDPQQRLCLSLAQELTADLTLPQNTSVFIGASDTGWSQFNTLAAENRYLLAGSHLSMTSARISYHFDLTAKSKTIDTSCSSSLVAISESFDSVLSGDCKFSICGGVNLFNDPFKFAQLKRMKMLSPNHRCYTFKQAADGYVRSEGGALFLLASEDTINEYNLTPLAKINGCFVNHDGLSAGITAPSLQSQISLHQNCLNISGLHDTNIGYIECHGTGTPLGDPIELKALDSVFNTDPVLVGSIKSKFGHLEAAAGAAGLVNCLSFLQDHNLPIINESTPTTDKFSFTKSCLTFSDKTSSYFSDKSFSKAILVSSFGFSGTNASLIMSPVLSQNSISHSCVALFPGQGRFDPDLGLHEYNSSSIYRESADSYWLLLRSVLSSIVDFPSNFSERSYNIPPLHQQYLSLVHSLSLYQFSLQSGAKYDFLIGYSFGEYAASVASSSLSFEDCILALYEREKLVQNNRGLFHLYYIDHTNLTTTIVEEYLPKEVIACSPTSSIYAISSSFFDEINTSSLSDAIKYVGVDYCYHSSILIDEDTLPDSFLTTKLDLANSQFLPSWGSSPTNPSWDIHFLYPLRFDDLLTRVRSLSGMDISVAEISSKPTLKRIVDQNIQDIKSYSPITIVPDLPPSPNPKATKYNSLNDNSLISNFILEYISECSGLEISLIDRKRSFTRCGLDSLELGQLVSKLASKFSVSFTLEELVGNFQVINDAIEEAILRSSSSTSNVKNVPIASPINPQPISPLSSNTLPPQPTQQSYSREEIINSIYLGRTLLPQIKGSCSRRNSYSSLADPRYSAGYSSLNREYQVPLVAESAFSSHIISVDNVKYLDFTMGFGVQLFGHNPDFITKTLADSLANNAFFVGPQSKLASLNSKLLCELTCHDRALFCNTGTEAVMTAIRLSRAYTNKSKILIFNGSYHGHNDFTLASPCDLDGNVTPSSLGTPQSIVSDTLIADYHDLNSITRIVRDNSDSLAAILVEPIQSRKPSVNVVKSLHLIRQLCDEYNILLIFDEVLIGFRCHTRSTYGYLGVKSDLSCYGKIIGGGLPIGAVAGNSDILNLVDGGAWYQSDVKPYDKRIFFAGTFNKNPLTMICCNKVLSHLIVDQGRSQVILNNTTRRVCNRLNQFFVSKGVSIRVMYASSVFRFTGVPSSFYHELLARNIYIWEGRTCFLSTAHSPEDLEYFVSSIFSATDSLIRSGVIDSSELTFNPKYLLAPTQLSLCAAYTNLPRESQSFNQIVSISGIESARFSGFLDRALSCMSAETSLFGFYDLVDSSFTPSSHDSCDWVRYYNDETFEFQEFHPTSTTHVQCAVVFKNNLFESIHFCFAHYAIDGKGLNDLFLRILKSGHSTSSLPSGSTSTSDITSVVLSELTNDHFKYLDRGPSVERFEITIPSPIRSQLVAIAESQSISLPTLILAFYINALQSSISHQSLIVALFGTSFLSPSEAYLYQSFIAPTPLVVNSQLCFDANALSSLQQSISRLVLNTVVDASTIASKFNIKSSSIHYPLTSFAFNFDKISPVFSNSTFDISFNEQVPSFPRWNIFLNVLDDLDSLQVSLDYNPLLIDKNTVRSVFDQFNSRCQDFTPTLDSFQPFICNTSNSIDDNNSPLYNLIPRNHLSLLVKDFSSHTLSSSDYSLNTNEFQAYLSNYTSLLSQYSDPVLCIRSADPLGQLLLILSCWHLGKAYILWKPLESDQINQARLNQCRIRSIINFKDFNIFHEPLSEFDCDDQSILFDDLAHLIFTSGSTGSPKAVPISIHHLASYQDSIAERITLSNLNEQYRFGILSSLSYDFPFTTILLWLKHGGDLFVVDFNSVKSVDFWSTIPEDFFSFIKILPPFFLTLKEFVHPQKLIPTDTLVFGGDRLSYSTSHFCYSHRASLNVYTHYGPTETCIGCSAFLVPQEGPNDDVVPVGSPLDGYEILLEPIPDASIDNASTINYPSTVGIISIITENTYGKYFDGSTDSFSDSSRYYTGDIGFIDNNNLTILGRISGFLKIQGHRVYLSDITTRISSLFPDLNFCLLPLPHPSPLSFDSDHFVLFYAGSSFVPSKIEGLLRDCLPLHLCPIQIHSIPTIPLSSNGKLDYSALLCLINQRDNQSSHLSDSSNVDDRSSTTSFLADCSAVFPGISLSLNSNFFQLGGDSLSAIRLSASFHRSGVHLSSELILTNPDFSALYTLYSTFSPTTKSDTSPTVVYNLTPSQKYFLQFFDPTNWYFSFLLDTSSSPSFVDQISSLLTNSNFLSFSFDTSGVLNFTDTQASIPVVTSSYPNRIDFFNDLQRLADSSVDLLCPSLAVNASITHVEIKDDNSSFCLFVFPHYLIDFLSLHLLLDSTTASSSDFSLPLGFPQPSTDLPLELPSHFSHIANCTNLLSADPAFRSSFLSTSYSSVEVDLGKPPFLSSDSSSIANHILAFIISSVNTIFKDDYDSKPLIDVEFGARNYAGIVCSSSLGYYSIHLPCIFDTNDPLTIRKELFDLQSNAVSLFSYLVEQPSVLSDVPICSVNCVELSPSFDLNSPSIHSHSLSSHELPLPWSPLMLEVECSMQEINLKIFFDEQTISANFVNRIVSHLSSTLSSGSSLDSESTDIMNRLGW